MKKTEKTTNSDLNFCSLKQIPYENKFNIFHDKRETLFFVFWYNKKRKIWINNAIQKDSSCNHISLYSLANDFFLKLNNIFIIGIDELKDINLMQCNLEYVEIKNCENLNSISLKNNNIKSFSISLLPSLTKLFLQKNKELKNGNFINIFLDNVDSKSENLTKDLEDFVFELDISETAINPSYLIYIADKFNSLFNFNIFFTPNKKFFDLYFFFLFKKFGEKIQEQKFLIKLFAPPFGKIPKNFIITPKQIVAKKAFIFFSTKNENYLEKIQENEFKKKIFEESEKIKNLHKDLRMIYKALKIKTKKKNALGINEGIITNNETIEKKILLDCDIFTIEDCLEKATLMKKNKSKNKKEINSLEFLYFFFGQIKYYSNYYSQLTSSFEVEKTDFLDIFYSKINTFF